MLRGELGARMPTDDPQSVRIPSPLHPGELSDRDPVLYGTEAQSARSERRALGWAAIAAMTVIAWIVMPIGVGIFLGSLLAFAVQPVFERLKPRLGATGSALAVVGSSILALTGTLGGLMWLLVAEGTLLIRESLASPGPGPGAGLLETIGRLTGRFGIPPAELWARIRALAEAGAAEAARFAQTLVGAAASSLFAIFLATLSMHFILQNWDTLALRAQEALPLRPDYTAALFAEFQRVGRTVTLGIVGSGIAQGILASVGFWMLGVPEPLFFGAATAVASLVPAVGSALVWLPVGVWLILGGHPTRGILELAWGATVVGALCDYFIRPRLVGRAGAVPSLVTFAALLGGVQAFGLKGLVVGPVLMSLAAAVLRLYASEARKRRSPAVAVTISRGSE
jgi:predicted PurR-regulated permease PerM